jgi:hypothetical protein
MSHLVGFGFQVEFLEFLCVVERLAHGIAFVRVLMKNLKIQLFGHQSRFDMPPPAMGLLVLPVTGHLLSSLDTFTSLFI